MSETAAGDDRRASYRDVFAVAEFRALFAAQVVSVLGNIIAEVALTVLVYSRTHSAVLSSLTFTLGFLPFLIGGTLLAGLVDRLPPRRTLIICDLSSATVIALMLIRAPVAVLLVLIFVAGLISPVFAGVRAAIVPEILGTGPEFVLGRSLYNVVWQGSQVLGFAGGGLLLTAVGARGSLALDSASFLGSALVVRLGLRRRDATAPTSSTGVLRDSLDSLGTVWRDRRMRRLMLLHWLVPTCALAPEAIIAPYVHLIGGPSRDVGILLSSLAGGMLLSNLVAGRLLTVRWQRRIMVPGALLCVVPLLGFGAHIGVAISLVLFAVSGLGGGWNLGRDSYFIESIPASLRARALAIDQSGLMVVQGLGFVAWGGVAELLSIRMTIALAGVVGVAFVTAFGHMPETSPQETVA